MTIRTKEDLARDCLELIARCKKASPPSALLALSKALESPDDFRGMPAEECLMILGAVQTSLLAVVDNISIAVTQINKSLEEQAERAKATVAAVAAPMTPKKEDLN